MSNPKGSQGGAFNKEVNFPNSILEDPKPNWLGKDCFLWRALIILLVDSFEFDVQGQFSVEEVLGLCFLRNEDSQIQVGQ